MYTVKLLEHEKIQQGSKYTLSNFLLVLIPFPKNDIVALCLLLQQYGLRQEPVSFFNRFLSGRQYKVKRDGMGMYTK